MEIVPESVPLFILLLSKFTHLLFKYLNLLSQLCHNRRLLSIILLVAVVLLFEGPDVAIL